MNRVTALAKSLGPAIIVASIVLGPGSILTSSKVGCQYGYDMIWVLVVAVVLMMGMTGLAAYLGALCRGTLCQELADRWGRPAAATVGILMFVIIACFQVSNNMAVVATVEALLEPSEPAGTSVPSSDWVATTWKIGVLLVLNTILIASLFGLKNLYRPLERLMMVMVLAMLLGFGANLFFVRPSLPATLGGLVPHLPAQDTDTALLALLGLVATTFSVAGAFYQSYLVREKGWGHDQVGTGMWDSIIGIATLGIVSLIIMLTSAAALHGVVPVDELKNVNDVARQLEPLFGPAAAGLFTAGLFAAALSSFLGNALIGGTILSDGLGWGASMQQAWPRRFTIAALATGAGVASYAVLADQNPVSIILLAQALTVLGIPLLAIILFGFGWRSRYRQPSVPGWLLGVAGVGVVVTVILAARMVARLMNW